MTARPPSLPRRPRRREFHGDVFDDPYEWVRTGGDEVIDHLKQENAYADAMTEHLAPLRETIFEEIRGRVLEDDASVAFRRGDYWHYSRTRAGEEYRSYHRCPYVPGEPRPVVTADPLPGETTLLDVNVIARERKLGYFSIGLWSISRDDRRMAFGIDTTGDEEHEVFVVDTETGEILDSCLRHVGDGIEFMEDGERLLYTRNDESWRPHELWVHRIGEPQENDRLVMREDDERFRLDLLGSISGSWLLVFLTSKLSSECHYIDSSAEEIEPVVVVPRMDGVTYDVDVWRGDQLLILHDRDHKNGCLAWAPMDCHDPDEWRTIVPGHDEIRIEQVIAFDDFVALAATREACETVKVLPLGRDDAQEPVIGEPYFIDPGFPIFSARQWNNLTPDTSSLLVSVESCIHPQAYYEVEVATGRMTLICQASAPGHDPARYREWREWAAAPDGTRIPVTMIARADVRPDGTAPALLYGYGAYETSVVPRFEIERFPLLDRGLVCAVAHVRGGGEMGRTWYEEGRLRSKMNSFTDFLACADHLVRSGWCDPRRLGAEGRSAGGLTIGAALNLAPERFAVVLAGAPFVDALTTILMPEMPLTVGEWEEWGNPVADAGAYAYMKGYSPYENVHERAYPSILATTSLNDSRVSYVEPLKWVAALRDTTSATSERPVLLRCEMLAGHGGPSGRYSAWREMAWEDAFVLDALGCAGADPSYPQR